MPFQKGNTLWKLSNGLFKKGHISYNKGKKMSNEQKEKIRNSCKKYSGENHWNWQGDQAGYDALHEWIKSKLGKAKKCTNGCNNKKRYEWANISGEYKRDISDWHELCTSCNQKDGIKVHDRFSSI